MTTHNKHTSHKTHAKQTAHKPANHTAVPAQESHRQVEAAVAPRSNKNTQTFIVFALVIAAFFGAYRFAKASNSSSTSVSTGITNAATQSGDALGAGAAGGACGGGCCGGGGAPIEGVSTVEGNVQKISVDLSSGSYNPNVIKLKAGVPTEITFGASGGCTAVVASADLGFQEDLTTGPKTVKLAGLAAGTYGFACGMNMVTGQIVVE